MERITSKLVQEVLTLLKKGGKYRASNIDMRTFRNSSNNKVDCIKLDLEIYGRCQHPVFDVRFIESIEIRVVDERPSVYVRVDFPIVPHLMVSSTDNSKWLCLSEQSFEEYRHKMNARYLLECIISWFEKTAKGELHRDDQALEPFFFGSQNVIVFSPQAENSVIFTFFTEKQNDGARILVEDVNGEKCFACLEITVKPEAANVIHHKPKSLSELASYFPNEDITGRYLNLLCQIIDEAKNEQTINTCFKDDADAVWGSGIIIKLNVPLVRESGSGKNGNDYKIFVFDSTLLFACNNLKNKKPWDDLPGQLFMPHTAFNRSTAQWLNGVKTTISPNSTRITMVGGGAVGSHLFECFLRAGYGIWTIIDDDTFWSHNNARHTLSSAELGVNKAKALSERAKAVISDFRVNAIDNDAFSSDTDVLSAYKNAEIIIDASASSAVERHLAQDIVTDARKISCFLNPRGTSAVFFMEDASSICRLDLIEMQYYRVLIENPKYTGHLDLPEGMAYAPACRSVTNRLPEDSVALSSALFSKAIKAGLNDHNAKMIIWSFDDEQIFTDRIEPDIWQRYYSCFDGKWAVEINDRLLQEMHKQARVARPNETGGVLYGCFDNQRKKVYVVGQVKAPVDSSCSPVSFIRGCVGLRSEISKIENITHENLVYIGEWHSHPSDNTQQSGYDKKLMKEICDYNYDRCRPACMIIIGQRKSSISIYVQE